MVVVRGGHEYVLNSAGLARWGITVDTSVPAGGEISRYDDGSLNGELIDAAKNLVSLDPPPQRDVETRIADQLAEHSRLHAAGLTSIRHPGGAPDHYELLAELKRRGELRIRVNFLFRARGARTAEELGAVVDAWPAAQDEGDEWLRVGGVKLGVDGGFEGGWMREPYAEPLGRGGTFRGLQTMPADRFTIAVSELNRRGWRVATHAVGDAAIDQVLAGYEAADARRSIGDRRWTIEHGFIAAADQLARIRELGLVLSAQHHLYVAGPSLEQYWGRSRAECVTPVRTYLDHGIAVSLGSDSPVVPFPPLRVLYHFTTRDTITGGVFGPDERISREEALRALTLGNAWLTFEAVPEPHQLDEQRQPDVRTQAGRLGGRVEARPLLCFRDSGYGGRKRSVEWVADAPDLFNNGIDHPIPFNASCIPSFCRIRSRRKPLDTPAVR